MQASQLPKRLQSIDVFRAITMLLMVFVNDAASVNNLPAWLGHIKGDEDGFGFADTVFPAFLFIAGMSIPFAIRNRISRGATFLQVLFYIASRAFTCQQRKLQCYSCRVSSIFVDHLNYARLLFNLARLPFFDINND
jgi:predicted acyltransferase